MYKCITADGEISYKKRMSLKQMQKFVGGYIEIVGNIICNEEGLLQNLEVNSTHPQFVGNIIIKERGKNGKDKLRNNPTFKQRVPSLEI